MKLTQQILEYIEAHRQEAYDLLLELAKIPAPSNHEERRAAFCKAWLERQGAKGVYIDEALNVIYPVGCTQNRDLMAFVAHSDVVFPDTDTLPLKVEDGRIYCPGVGDDTANVVALLMAAKYIAKKDLQPKNCGVLLVVNSGEEGLGNLKGTRKLVADFGSRIREFVAFDSHDCVCDTRAVGSKRFRVAVDTEGGHSFTSFGNLNAIACLASMIDTLYRIPVPEKGRTTYNVGTISGGTSVNTIAQHAEMLYEFRSDEGESLAAMQEKLDAVVDAYRKKGIQVTVTPVGERPCAADIDGELQGRIVARADAASMRHYHRKLSCTCASTDCNIPMSVGIPSVCVGCYSGAGSHTRGEYVEISSLLPGVKLACELILHHF